MSFAIANVVALTVVTAIDFSLYSTCTAANALQVCYKLLSID